MAGYDQRSSNNRHRPLLFASQHLARVDRCAPGIPSIPAPLVVPVAHLILRRLVGDQTAGGVGGVDSEVNRTVYLLIRADIPELHALGVGVTFFDLDGRNCRWTPPVDLKDGFEVHNIIHFVGSTHLTGDLWKHKRALSF